MKKILIITKTLSLNDGQGRYSVDMINQLKKHYELSIFTFDKIFSLRFIKSLRSANFVHCFSDYPYCLIILLCICRKEFFITVHGTYGVLPLDKIKSKFLLKLAYKKANKIFCVSSFTQKEILKRIKLNNTIVINNGVDYKKFQIDQPRTEKGKIILSVGALKPRKGYHVSIPAVAEIKKKYPEIKYHIVGGRPTEVYLRLVENYGLKENVKFFYNISDKELIRLYCECDVFLLPSITKNNNDFEGFGLVYLEAGACGKPVIGAYGSGAEDAIINGETGILVPQNDVCKTTDAILKLLNDSGLAKKIGERGNVFAKNMDWENVIKNYIKAYDNI